MKKSKQEISLINFKWVNRNQTKMKIQMKLRLLQMNIPQRFQLKATNKILAFKIMQKIL